MIRVREMSQVLGDLCMALLLKHFECGLCGPARQEAVALPLPWGFTAAPCLAFSGCKRGITSL